MVSKAQIGIGTLGVLLEEYDDFMQTEKEREERDRQDHREEIERKLKRQGMDMKHAEEMERLRIVFFSCLV